MSIAGGSPTGLLKSKRYRPEWERYTKRLKSTGYFSGEIEGSARHKQLTAKAAETFASKLHARQEDPAEETDLAQKCADLLQENKPFRPEKVSLGFTFF